MRHRTITSPFGRSSAHRKAMLAALVCSLIGEKRIKTTLARAKSARQLAEKMVTMAKSGTLADRRKAVALLGRKSAVRALFEEIAPQFRNRAGGYTRITKLGRRRSDSSCMAIVEWVSISYVDKKKKPVPSEKAAAVEGKTG